ncbi:MAG: hypothetical protein Kow0098_04070 [Ignavibacteriaceae bacterium]
MAKNTTGKKRTTSKTRAKKTAAGKKKTKTTRETVTTKKKQTKKTAGSKSAAKVKKAVKPKSTAKKETKSKKGTKTKSITAKTPVKKKEKTNQIPQVQEQPKMSSAEARAEALKKIKGYSKKDLEHFRQIIIERRDEIIEQLQNLKEQMLDPTTGEYINENSPYSLHMAEQGTDAMEREKTFLYAQRENKFLGYLEDALKRIDAGTYGICIECIEEPQHLCETCPLIPKARLEAVPHSQLCLPIKQRQEKK